MTVAATIALGLFLWWSSLTVCMLLDWARSGNRPPPESPPESLPPAPEPRWPTLREYADEPSLILRVVVGCVVTAVFAFLFLPLTVCVVLFWLRPAKTSMGGSAGSSSD